jgi:hypothetical protein
MKICIRRGAKQIGGTCIEIESRKAARSDIGQPGQPGCRIGGDAPGEGLNTPDDSLLGVLVPPASRPLWTGVSGSAFYTLPHGCGD